MRAERWCSGAAPDDLVPLRTTGRYWSFRACVTARFSKCFKFASKPWRCAALTLLTLRLGCFLKRCSENMPKKRCAYDGALKLTNA